MGFDFNGQRVVVAGGSRGIGRSVALGFAQAGAAVSVCARNVEGLKAVEAELAAYGHPVHTAPCDLADGNAISTYIDAAGKALGGIDILINNASGFGGGDTEAGWEAGIQVDLMATVRAGHAALPFLRQSANAAIVNLTTISALRPSTRTQSYAAIKAAVMHYTASHALTLAPDRIRVNAVAPGSIEFPGGAWRSARARIPSCMSGFSSRFRSAVSGRRRKSPARCCFLQARTLAGSPARPWWWMAGRF